LGDVVDLQAQVTRTPSALNSVNYLLSKGTNTRITELADNLDQKIETAKQNEQLKETEILQQLDQQIENLQIAISQDKMRIETVDAKVAEIRANLANFSDSRIGDLNFQDLEDFKLSPEGFKELLALNIRDFPEIQDLKELNQKIADAGILSTIPEIKEELTNTSNILEDGLQRVIEQRKIQDTEELQKLQAELEEAKSLVDQELAKIQKTEDFIENRSPQNLDIDSQTNLSFQQGIYDFAVSYHFGDIPNYRLPEKPSGRNYPLFWFQPIAGMRLNNISVNIEETINVVATSTLVNFSGSFKNNYGQTRTWLEPMIGAKLGMQLNDRIGFWLRGDASGFGLAGETDMSWNIYTGMDWWVGYNTSLQLGYRFYEIDYSWGSGNNAFGFKESFNGPFLSATFHF
jgi:predicted  nucleic acid-binding Zn-ribbon protein